MCSNNHFYFFFFNDTATTEIYTLSLHDALPISIRGCTSRTDQARDGRHVDDGSATALLEHLLNFARQRSEEHTSELQSRLHLVCRLLLEKKKKNQLVIHISLNHLH